MKYLILCFTTIIYSFAHAQEISASIQVQKNATTIEVKPINAIDTGSVLTFTVKNATNEKKLLIDGYTVSFFSIDGGKEGKQIPAKRVTLTVKKPGNSIDIQVNELYRDFQFSKITIELNQPYYLNRKKKTPITLHHAKRSFTFLL